MITNFCLLFYHFFSYLFTFPIIRCSYNICNERKSPKIYKISPVFILHVSHAGIHTGLNPNTAMIAVFFYLFVLCLACMLVIVTQYKTCINYTLIVAVIPRSSLLASRIGFTTSVRNSSTCSFARPVYFAGSIVF